MEISSFSSPYSGSSSEDYLSSNLFSFFQELDPIAIPANNTSSSSSSQININLSKKRKRVDHEPTSSSIQDFVNTFLTFDSDNKQQEQQQEDEFLLFPSLASFSQSPSSTSPMREMKEGAIGTASESKRARRSSPEVGASEAGTSSQRRLWVKDRSKAWWEHCNSADFPEEEFRKAFRMSKATFDMICDELESVVTKKDTMLRLAIPVRQRVAVCIWRLATG